MFNNFIFQLSLGLIPNPRLTGSAGRASPGEKGSEVPPGEGTNPQCQIPKSLQSIPFVLGSKSVPSSLTAILIALANALKIASIL